MRMILQDEDITTKIENDWKRLNTLAHYQVGTVEGRRGWPAGPSSLLSQSWNNRSPKARHPVLPPPHQHPMFPRGPRRADVPQQETLTSLETGTDGQLPSGPGRSWEKHLLVPTWAPSSSLGIVGERGC